MGTIQDKLEYLHTSLDLVRQNLESYGYEISEMTTRKICEMLSEGIENTLLFNFRKIIDRWFVFENGRIYDKLTGEDYDFTYTYEEGSYTFSKSTNNLATDYNTPTQYNILFFNLDGYYTDIDTGLIFSNPAKATNNISYYPCYDSDTVGYFLYEHFDYDGDLSQSYFNDGEFTSDIQTLVYSSAGANSIRFSYNKKERENSNIVFFKRELSLFELQIIRLAFGIHERGDIEKAVGEIIGLPVENRNSVSDGAYFKRYYHVSKLLTGTYPYIIKKDNIPMFKRSLMNNENTLLEKNDMQYDSVHITNLTDEYQVGDCLPIESYPIPFHIGDLYQPQYVSDNEDVVKICGDVMYCVGPGSANIILSAGDKTDAVNVTVSKKESQELKDYYVDEELFGSWETNQDIIFGQIQYAYDNGYNHIIFPKIDINVIVHYFNEGVNENLSGDKSGYRVPSNMKIDFPKGCRLWFHKGKACESGYSFFCFNGVENTEINVDTLIGERYDFRNSDGTYGDSSRDYSPRCTFVCDTGYIDGIENGNYMYGRNIRCKVNIENSTDVIGFHITVGGGFNFWNLRNVIPKGTLYNDQMIDGAKYGTIDHTMMEYGTFDDSGSGIDSNDWIRTNDFIDISYKPEIFDEYYFGRYGGYSQPHEGRLNKIVWYNSANEVVECKIIGTYVNYKRPQNGVKFKIACMSNTLPDQNSTYADDNCWARLGVSCTDLFWNIRIGYNNFNESGCLSVIGDTKGLVLYDSVIQSMGRLYNWSVDFEDGWYLMRSNIILNCLLGNLVNHSHNLSALNTFFGRYIAASYCARFTAIDCVLNTINNQNFTEERELLTTVRCMLSKFIVNNLENCLSLKQDNEESELNNINYISYAKTITDEKP